MSEGSKKQLKESRANQAQFVPGASPKFDTRSLLKDFNLANKLEASLTPVYQYRINQQTGAVVPKPDLARTGAGQPPVANFGNNPTAEVIASDNLRPYFDNECGFGRNTSSTGPSGNQRLNRRGVQDIFSQFEESDNDQVSDTAVATPSTSGGSPAKRPRPSPNSPKNLAGTSETPSSVTQLSSAGQSMN